MNSRLLFFLLMVLLVLPGNTSLALTYNSNHSSGLLDSAKLSNAHGYTDITYSDNEFVAVGSDGRIDRISMDGIVNRSETITGESFNCILAAEQYVFVAGKNGAILVSLDNGPFRKMNSGTDNNINSLALFNNKIIAATDGGEVLIGSTDGKFSKIRLNLKGNIVSLSAGESACYGATDEGEIMSTTDGITWTVFDFNKVYAGFYKPCRFTTIFAGAYNIAVAGIYEDGSPVLMFSTQGNVWAERTLDYNDAQANHISLNDTPNDIFYDPQRDLFYLSCNNGTIMSIPSCSHCNKASVLTSENLTAIWCEGDIVMVAGTNFYIESVRPE